MSIKLKGSTAGSVALDAPANTSPSGSDIALTLPIDAGSANQYLRNSSTAGSLEFVTHRGFVTYAIICDQKTSSADGGTATSGAWRTRDLNTEIADPDGIVSISSNQFTLGAGTYLIKFSAPACQVEAHQAKLYDITGTADVQLGSTEFSGQAPSISQSRSIGAARVSISGNNVYEIRHRVGSTKATFGFGVGPAGPASWGDHIFTQVEIYKEA